MPHEERPLKVFLCHASVDKPKVRELYRYLRRRGIKPWFDELDLVGGQDWQVEIPKALATSDAIIICLTKNAVDKEGYIQKEIKFALDKALEMPEGRIYLIPVRFEECEVPYSLSRFHWVDLFERNGFPRLMKSLRTRAAQLERAAVEIPKQDEPKPDLSSTPEPLQSEHQATTIVEENAVPPEAGSQIPNEIEQEKTQPLQPVIEADVSERVAEETVSPLATKAEPEFVDIRSLSKRDVRVFGILIFLIIVIYSALITSPLLRSLGNAFLKPTLTLTNNAGIVFTAAAQTANAQLTRAAVPLTQAPPSASSTSTNIATPACDQAQFVSDVTIPDGTIVSPGQSFTKTWRLKNAGTCAWTTGYILIFISGNSMDGPVAQALPSRVASGQSVDISVNLRAPTSPGRYQGNWSLRNSSGIVVSFGPKSPNTFFVVIKVENPITNTP